MRLTCLIVDDSAEFRRSAKRLLNAEGLTVIGESSTAADARRYVSEGNHVDVILVDVELGEDDGVALAAELVAAGPGPAIILVSSRDAGLDSAAIPAGVAGFLPKFRLSAASIRELHGAR